MTWWMVEAVVERQQVAVLGGVARPVPSSSMARRTYARPCSHANEYSCPLMVGTSQYLWLYVAPSIATSSVRSR